MTLHHGLGTAESVRALTLKVSDMQKELAELRKDVRRLLFLMEKQKQQEENAAVGVDGVEKHSESI